MSSRLFLKIACTLALAACSFALCEAAPDTQARAQVLARELPGGARLVFLWDSRERMPFAIDRRGNQVILHFDDPVSLDWGSSLEAVSSYVSGVKIAGGGDTVILTLARPAKARYLHNVGRDETENDRNGIDLVEAQSEPQEPLKTLSLPPSRPAKAYRRKAALHAHHRQARKALEAKAKAKPAGIAVASEAGKMAALAPSAGAPSTPVPTTSAPLIGPAAQPMLPRAAPVIADKAILPLPFKPDEPFAVFTLRGTLWIVAEHFTTPPLDALRKAGAPFVKDAQALPDPHATIITMPLESDVSASVEKASADTVDLLLAREPAKLSRAFLPMLEASDKKISLLIPAGKADKILSIRDPATGTMLNVAPVAEPGAGIASGHSFAEFSLLPSAQGVIVQSLADDLSISMRKGVIEIASANGLAISPEIAQQLKDMESEVTLAHLPPTLFPYARWKLDDEKNYVPMQIRLFHDIAFGAPDSANKARLKLLGLFLGEGLFPEALGMADDILRSSLKFYRENKVSALRGAAYFFMYRINEAERDFSAPELAGDLEAAMWRALCGELLGENKQAFNFSANYDRYISHYPPSFIQKLAIIAADRSIAAKDYDGASAIFETLKRDGYDEPVKKYVDYMRAKIFSETRSESEAVKIWEEQAKDLSDPLIRARAEFSLINLLLKNDKITHDDAIKRLEKLRIVWRGDSLELEVLTLLGNLYLQEKQYANALHTMRDIVMYYPEVPEAITTARQMEQTFVTLYNKDGADTMPPLEALALFYEFRDLVPLGAAGDQMIRNLADRLVSLDLLDRAAMLLEHQIKNRLQGEERSRVGARLAQIYLLNHQPDKALETLKTTGYGDLSPALQLERLRMTARALAQQGKLAKAVEVIGADNSPEGALLRLSIYWDGKDWPNVVSIAEDILGNRNDPSAPLTPTESDVLLKLATAYVYEHDTGQLQYLRDYFTPLMKNNPNRASFLFITSESGAVDYDNLAGLDQDINAVKAFLSSTQDKLGKNGLSKVAN